MIFESTHVTHRAVLRRNTITECLNQGVLVCPIRILLREIRIENVPKFFKNSKYVFVGMVIHVSMSILP